MSIKAFKISSFSLYVILMMCSAMLIILWSALTRINDHKQYHKDVSLITTQKTANDVSYYLKENRRLIHLFANRKAAELWKIFDNPDDDKAFNKLLNELKAYFPNAETYTITDTTGHTHLVDFDNQIGEKCIHDLMYFIKTGKQHIRIHPSATYHFDIITHFEHNNKKGIFFVSFKTDMISNSLLRAEIPGHFLLLSLPDEAHLIEVISEGARNVWIRDQYKLTTAEKERILSQTAVDDTEWAVVDLHEKSLLSDYRDSIFIRSNLIIFILAVSGLLFMILNHREITRRKKAELVKDEFLSIVSHELRTPLTAINGAITLINNGATGEVDPKTKSLLQIADHNTQRLTLLVNDLLDVQRLETKKMKFKRRLIKPIEFVESAVADIKSGYSSESCNIRITNTLNDELVFADSSRMEQVVDNIIANAIKYGSAKDSIDINLSKKEDFILISITDYGEGISEESQNKIFEKFTQSKMTDNRHESGSGLGLYIVKMIIEYHGGEITYVSERGKGTTFYIQLPAIKIKKTLS